MRYHCLCFSVGLSGGRSAQVSRAQQRESRSQSQDLAAPSADAAVREFEVALFLIRLTTVPFVVIALFAFAVCAAPVKAETKSQPLTFKSNIQPFFKVYCTKCHGAEKNKGGISLVELKGDFCTEKEIEQWEQVLEMLDGGAMPPSEEPQPKEEARTVVARWIESRIRDSVQTAKSPTDPAARRLTNVEYQNTLRDLLGFELQVIDDLPEDPLKPYHFNNTAEFMRIGPEQIDRYLEVARRAMASAIVDPGVPAVHKHRREWKPSGIDRGMGLDEIGVMGNRRGSAAGGFSLKSWPKTGDFRIRLQASAILPAGTKEVPLNLLMGYPLDRNSQNLQVKSAGIARLRNSPDNSRIVEFRGRIENFPVEPARGSTRGKIPEKLVINPRNHYDDGTLNDYYGNDANLVKPRVVLNWIEFEAPMTEVWPPAHHTRILFESPVRNTDPDAYLREVLRRFMSRAYRRPVTDAELDRFVKIHSVIASGLPTLEAALRETLAMVLISPQFLYHTESDPATDHHYAMASKLSYFLWASMPDAVLLRIASEGRLSDAAIIEQQVLRMLADDRSGDFIENFTTQWLSIDKMKTVPINKELYPRFLYYVARGERAGTEVPYRPTVRDFMMKETIGFVGELIRRNASVLNVIDSDFAFLNQRLAAHYGVQGVHGDELRAVPIKPEHSLGGLLTHGSVLIENGTGTAPHPIYRAVWLREAILGDEVPAPPAEVPALSDTAGESAEKALSIAELLAKHRTVESCNDCHARLDPWGIPFEEYNAIGNYQPKVPKEGTRVRGFRTEEDKNIAGYQSYLDSINTVDVFAQTEVPNGPKVDGMRELKRYLLEERKDDIVENVIRRLLQYGLGRELTYRDRFAIEELAKSSARNDNKLRDIIVAICQSEIFREERK